MKPKVLFSLRSIIFTLLFVCCFLIDTLVKAQNLRSISDHISITVQSDTATIDNKDVLLENSPMLFFPDYNKLFNYSTEVVILITGGGREKGYSVNFIVKDSILYLKRVTPKGTDFVGFNADKKDTTRVYAIKVSKEEIKARVEKMTGRKFDENGLLQADWVSGEFYGGVDGKFNRSFYSSKTYYKIYFEKGVMKKLIVFEDKRPG